MPAPTVKVSTEAEQFAKAHGLWEQVEQLKTLILETTPMVGGVRVALVSQAENWMTFSFTIETSASVPEILDFGGRLHEQMAELIPASEHVSFKVLFEFHGAGL